MVRLFCLLMIMLGESSSEVGSCISSVHDVCSERRETHCDEMLALVRLQEHGHSQQSVPKPCKPASPSSAAKTVHPPRPSPRIRPNPPPTESYGSIESTGSTHLARRGEGSFGEVLTSS